MSVHTRQDLERLSRFTRQRYSRALMSDIKWRKFFAAVNGSGWHPSFVEVMRFPNQDNFWGPPQWVDTSEFGPIELRSIEWLMIPAIVADRSNLGGASSSGVPQDLEAIRTALSQAGQFPLEDVPEGLRIVGYR
jgi:hypothetical protein